MQYFHLLHYGALPWLSSAYTHVKRETDLIDLNARHPGHNADIPSRRRRWVDWKRRRSCLICSFIFLLASRCCFSASCSSPDKARPWKQPIVPLSLADLSSYINSGRLDSVSPSGRYSTKILMNTRVNPEPNWGYPGFVVDIPAIWPTITMMGTANN